LLCSFFAAHAAGRIVGHDAKAGDAGLIEFGKLRGGVVVRQA
jgi:hypothetical protein